MELGRKVIYTFKILIGIILSLLVLLVIFKLIYYIFSLIYFKPLERFAASSVKDMLGDILLVFVLIELLRTVYVYITNQDVYINALIEAALIAVLRKIILVEVENLSALYILSLSLLFAIIAIVYIFISKKD